MESELKDMQVPDDLIEIWQRIVDSVAIFLSVPGVMINRLKPPELYILLSNRESPIAAGTSLPMEGLYCTEVAIKNRKLQVDNALMDEHWADSPTAKEGIIAYKGFPLQWPDGMVFGTLCAVDTQRNEWGERADTLLHTLKDVIESHLELIISGADPASAGTQLESALNRVLTLHGFSPLVSH